MIDVQLIFGALGKPCHLDDLDVKNASFKAYYTKKSVLIHLS